MIEMAYLPDELLEKIRKRLDTSTKIDVSRFRAVCGSWRSTIRPFDQKQRRFPIRLLFRPPIDGSGSNTFTLSKSVVYHLQPPPSSNSQYSRGWVTKVKQPKLGKTHLLHPLSPHPLKLNKLPNSFPQVLNLLDFRVFELANALHLISNNNSISTYRVAMSSNSDCPALMFVAFGKLFHYKLLVHTGNWTLIDGTIFDYHYQDVIFYQGKLYAVNVDGRVVVVDSSLNSTTIASPVDDGHFHMKYFVESLGELLLVDRRYYNHKGFKVYKLNAIEKQWVEMKTLGDRMLFVGDDCCFSASAQDFLGSQGNCIYFTSSKHDPKELSQIEVFNLGDGTSSPLDLYHLGSANIFLPTPNLA